jgi:hypothetical protein
MSAALHTPGPWTLVHKGGSNFAVQRFEIRGMFVGRPNTAPIFNKDTSAIDGTTICCSPENARLIAAAPDLLAALKLLDEAFCADDYGTREGRDKGRKALIAARAAREKATGSASHG